LVLVRSQFLEGAGGPYFGRARNYDPSLTSAIKHIIKTNLSKIIFVLELQWVLLIFALLPRQETGFEASGRNKDASHMPTARKLTLDALRTIRLAAVLARPSPNRLLKTKRREEERRERKEKEGRRERGEKARSGASKQPPIMTQV
jgi:hypothetical protein